MTVPSVRYDKDAYVELGHVKVAQIRLRCSDFSVVLSKGVDSLLSAAQHEEIITPISTAPAVCGLFSYFREKSGYYSQSEMQPVLSPDNPDLKPLCLERLSKLIHIPAVWCWVLCQA